MNTDLFAPISLEELDGKAKMMTRLDNKYVLSVGDFERLLPAFAKAFDILDIGGKRSFAYRTCYFDSPTLCSFRHHVQGRRHRSKVRVRHYLDAGLCFLEVKLKSTRKITVKKRQAHDIGSFDSLPQQALGFVEACHSDMYARDMTTGYAPVIQMQYDRQTLVAREGGERVTIDMGLHFRGDGGGAEIAEGMMIIETKSRFGRGRSDTILRRAGHHPIGSCSKYCVGLAALSRVPRFNKFLPAYRKLLPHFADGVVPVQNRTMPVPSGAAPE